MEYMPNSAFESGRSDERRVLVPALKRRAAQRELYGLPRFFKAK